MELLARIALVLPDDERQARLARQVLRELAGSPSLDLLTVGPGGDGTAIEDVSGLGDALAKARDAGTHVTLRAADALEGARAAWSSGAIDGWITLTGPDSGPRLRVRQGCAVLEPTPLGAVAGLPERLKDLDLRTPVVVAQHMLESLRASGPLVAFDVEGVDAVTVACSTIGPDVPVVGPIPPAEAARAGAAAFLAWTRAQADLPLALAGEGPETVLSLGGEPWAWPAQADAAGAVQAAERLALVAAGAGPLAAERSGAVKGSPLVLVAPTADAGDDRCPFCWRGLDASPAGTGPRPGPPVRCGGCGTLHHRDCLGDHGACTVLGCESTNAIRLGVKLPIDRLGSEAPRECAFASLGGDGSLGPRWLRVEAPIDDPRHVPRKTVLSIELGRSRVVRGSAVEGYVAVATPRPLRVRGGAIRIRASLTTLPKHGDAGQPKEQLVLCREAPFLADGPATALGRLGASLFAASRLTTIPPGVRRYPFSFLLDPDHPATLKNVREDLEEELETVLEVALDTVTTRRPLEVTP